MECGLGVGVPSSLSFSEVYHYVNVKKLVKKSESPAYDISCCYYERLKAFVDALLMADVEVLYILVDEIDDLLLS